MARFLKYIYPGANGDELTLFGPLNGPGSIPLNGTLSNPINKNVSFISNGYCRTISLTSPKDLTAITFTVTGTQNGVEITEDIGGPNDNTVFGTKVFDVITGFSADMDAGGADFSAGGGINGYITLISMDPFLNPINYSVRASEEGTIFLNDITLTLYGSNEQLALNGLTYPDHIAQGLVFVLGTSPNTFLFPDGTAIGGVAPFIPGVTNLLFKIDSQAANILRKTIFTFSQV